MLIHSGLYGCKYCDCNPKSKGDLLNHIRSSHILPHLNNSLTQEIQEEELR